MQPDVDMAGLLSFRRDIRPHENILLSASEMSTS
jgi:hypothetical protein